MRRALTLSAVLTLFAAAPVVAETVQATWKPQTTKFTYIGTVQLYTCQGLRGKARALIKHLGARDIKVTVRPCFEGQGDVSSLYNVTYEYSALVEADAGDSDTVEAQWEKVMIGRNHPRSIEDHNCELVERFNKYALPKMDYYRIVEGDAHCSAARSSLVGRLYVNVLKPDGTGG